MIRKPNEDDFREGDAVNAMHETRKITVEGAQGIARGVDTLILIWFGGIMAFGFFISLVTATAGLALIPIGIFGVMYWRSRRKDAARHQAVLQAQPQSLPRASRSAAAPWGGAADADVAFPADVRRQGCVEADIGAIVQQAFVLFAIGAILMVVRLGGIGIIVGMMFVVLAVIIGSRAFGDRKLIEWDTRKVKVWHLVSEGEMQWSDVCDVTVETASRTDILVYLQSGSHRNIVLTAAHNRLGGPTLLRVPIRYMNLPQDELERLLRDLFCWRAAGNSIAPGVSHAQAEPPSPSAAPITPLTDPRHSFDPDAIIARHQRERAETLAAVGREDIAAAHSRPSPNHQARPVFGRKRA